MSLIQPLFDFRGSTLTAMTFTLRFSNSALIFATVPNSVVQTGVKSAGCENKTPQEFPSHWWKSMLPSVVVAVKFGARSPNRSAICFFDVSSFFGYTDRIVIAQASFRPQFHTNLN